MLFSVLALSLTGAQALRSNVAGSPTVKVFGADNNQVKPDNVWKGGSEQLITWKFEGPVPKVRIYVWRSIFWCVSAKVKLVAHNVKNTGSHVVTVPTGLVPGAKYLLEVVSETDDRVYAFSPTFTIDESATPPEINDVALGWSSFSAGRACRKVATNLCIDLCTYLCIDLCIDLCTTSAP